MPAIESAAMAWVILAVVAAIVEVSIPHFGLIFVSVGAIAAAIVSGIGHGLVFQLVTFIVALGASLGFLRPRMMSRLGSQGVPSRTEGLLGREGVVTSDIDSTVGAGRVNVGGEDWAARSATPLAAGTRIRVVGADGIVLEVVPA
ncbi:MAG TPA: NfeD family protein [Vicinamibacterales bacterium]|nr:NfeD family protein [Vicinamibacterales bacterium]